MATTTVKVWQGKHDDGTTDTDETGGHYAYWEVHGDSNNLASYQTDTNRSGGGGRYHYLDNYEVPTMLWNIYKWVKQDTTGIWTYTDIQILWTFNNVVMVVEKTATLELNGNGHTVDVWQKGSNPATATIDLTFGTGLTHLT